MTGKNALRRGCLGLLLLLVGTHIAFAQPFTRRSSQVQHDGLKKYYEISRLQARRQIRPCQSLEMGKRRRGRHDAGIARRRQAAHRLHRDRHAAAQRGRRNHQCRRHQFLLFRRLHRHVRAVGQGHRAVRHRSHHRAGPSDRHRSLLCRDGRSARDLGRQQAVRRARDQNFRNTAITTWCRRTTACCATI